MTTLTLPVHDPAALAQALRDLGLPGQRSKTAITRLRRDRARRKEHPLDPLPLADRAYARTLRLYTGEIRRRGGETSIEGRYGTAELAVTDRDLRTGLFVLQAEGYRDYGSREGCHWSRLAYLCGTDDSGRWAVRIPGDITSVRSALWWVTPSDVRRAEAAGRRVRRQGDIYAIETTRSHDTPTGWVGADRRFDEPSREWVTSHHWNAETRYLTHRPEDGRRHRPLRVRYPVRFTAQRVYAMGRTSRRGAGD